MPRLIHMVIYCLFDNNTSYCLFLITYCTFDIDKIDMLVFITLLIFRSATIPLDILLDLRKES